LPLIATTKFVSAALERFINAGKNGIFIINMKVIQ